MNVPVYSATSIAINNAINSAAAINVITASRHGDVVVFHGHAAIAVLITIVIILAVLFAFTIWYISRDY